MSDPIRVRELRFGKPKKGKTKNVVESYPKPMLVLNFDMGGLDSVRSVPVTYVKRTALKELLAKKREELPPVVAIDCIYGASRRISSAIKEKWSGQIMQDTISDLNTIIFDTPNMPFRSLVIDSLTGLNDAAIGFVGDLNSKLMEDPRNWGGAASAKIKEIVNAVNSSAIECVVFLAHEQTSTDEVTEISETTPMVSGKYRQKIGADFSQFFYADTESSVDGKLNYIVRAIPTGLVKSVGVRTSDTMPAKCGPRYKDIYGVEP